MIADTLQSELPLSESAEALGDAVYVKDLDGRYLMVNAAAAATLGREEDEIIGRTDRDLLPDNWEVVRRTDQEVLAGGASRTIEESLVIDGEPRTYLSTKAPLRDGSGETIGLIGTSTDISARVANENELRQREAKLVEAQAVARVGSWEWDLVREEGDWSAEMYRIFGVCPDEFEPTYEAFIAAMHPEDRERVAAALGGTAETGEGNEVEYRVIRPSGEERTVLARAETFSDADGTPRRVVGAALDISEQKHTRERLRAREAMLKIAQDLTRTGNFEWDIDADRVSWSDGLYRIFGLEPGEIPATFEGYLERVHPEEREERQRTIAEVVETGRPAYGEHRILGPAEEVRWVESRIRALTDDSGRPTRLIGVCQDVTKRKRATQELERDMEAAEERALHDPLTGLANRSLALDRLEHAFVLAQRRDSDLAVLFVDIDGFKRVNDRFGHAVGDVVLRSVAERLRESVRGSDTVARIGGDEFLVICEEASGTLEALESAERIHEAFASPFELGGFAGTIEISIGASTLGGRGLSSAGRLVVEADAAMYETKRRGPGGLALHGLDG